MNVIPLYLLFHCLRQRKGVLQCQRFFYSSQKNWKITRPYQLAKSTSGFRQEDIDALKVRYIGVDKLFSEEIKNIPTYFYIRDYDRAQILNADIMSLVREERSLINYLIKITENEKVTKGTSESNTDSLVSYMVRKLELDEDPFMLRIHPDYKFFVGSREIYSSPKFSVEKNGLTMFIDEDKHLKDIVLSKKWGEYQIAGELLAVASTNHDMSFTRKEIKVDEEEVIYAMRVIGTKFTFYKAVVPHNYLFSLGSGLPNESFVIYRFPNNRESFSHYDYIIPEERKHVVQTLFQLRNQFIQS